MAKPKRNLLLIFIVLTYVISIFMALKIYKGKNDNHEIKPIYNIYLLKNDKTKYDKITKSDLISIDVSKIYDLNENGMINDKNQIIKDSNIFFESNELDKLLEKDIYISNEFSKNSILHKDKLMSYEDVIKDKILNYSFNGYIAYEIPYQKRMTDSLEIGLDGSTIKDDYKSVQKEFSINKDLEVDIFSQNKNDLKITKIISKAKIIDINDQKAIVCVSQDDMRILNENIDTHNILISMDDIENMEVYVYE